MKFDHGHIVNPSETGSGGLALFWDNSVHVSSIASTGNYINVSVLFTAEAFSCNVSWMYGTPSVNQKNTFWRSLYSSFCSRLVPWICLGDFNEILWSHEKWGGLPQPRWRINLFQEFVSRAELRDLLFQGPIFTWYCVQNKKVVIKERLDRGFANDAWISDRPNTQVFNLPLLGSDHRPILIDTSPCVVKAPKLFKFELLWTSHQNCGSIIQKIWKKKRNMDACLNWSENLDECAKALKIWGNSFFPNFSKAVNSETEKIQESMELENSCVSDLVYDSSAKINLFWSQEEMYWKQRARTMWLSHGDQNTQFFHQTTLMNKRRNKILRLKDSNGTWLSEEKEVVKLLNEHFKKSYQAAPTNHIETVLGFVENLITPEMNEVLLSSVSVDEVKHAVFDLGANKAPGPDGFSGIFYQHYWELINSLIVEATSSSCESQKVFSKFNHTYIALIPKVECPETPDQFKPIGLCNFAYKILSKVIANRLKKVYA